MMRTLLAMVGLGAGMLSATFCLAAEPVPRRGIRVLPKEGCVVNVGIEVMDAANFSNPFRIEEAEGDWLWFGPEKCGRVHRSQVVTLGEAPDYYTQQIERDNRNGWAYHLRGIAWFERREFDKALVDFGEAIRLKPNKESYNRRGAVWNIQKQCDRAIEDYTESIRLDPNYVSSYIGRALALKTVKRSGKAKQDIDHSMQIRSNLSLTYASENVALVFEKEFDKAIEGFDEAIRLDPKEDTHYTNRGIAWSGKQEFDKAIDDYS